MEKARKLEITRVLMGCSRAHMSAMDSIAVLVSRLDLNKDELNEFFAIDSKEKMSLYDEVKKEEGTNFSVLDLKLAAVLKMSYDLDLGSDICLSMMKELTEATEEQCIAFMLRPKEEIQVMFVFVDVAKDKIMNSMRR